MNKGNQEKNKKEAQPRKKYSAVPGNKTPASKSGQKRQYKPHGNLTEVIMVVISNFV